MLLNTITVLLYNEGVTSTVLEYPDARFELTRRTEPRLGRKSTQGVFTFNSETGDCMDRKYKQRGYQQDSDGEQKRPTPPVRPEIRSPKMMPFREVTRCALCGTQINIEIDGIAFDAQCPKCRADLRTCKNCISFDPGARFQCRKPVTVRVAKKDIRNECELFEPRKTIERQTTTTKVEKDDPRSAFDKLFKS